MKTSIVKAPRPIGSLAFATLVLGASPLSSQGTSAHELRGRAVEVHRSALQTRLQQLRSALLDTLKAGAPDLVSRVDPAPPPVPQGYQLLPRLLLDAPLPSDTGRRASLYSWPWTDTLIARAEQRVGSLELSLARSSSRQRSDYERLVSDFNGVAADRRLIDAHVEHNWFWQRAIAADTTRFIGPSRQIDGALRGASSGMNLLPAMPRVRIFLEDSGSGPVTIRIPIVTDVEDTAFMRSAQSTIERLWAGRANGLPHQVRLDIRFISSRALYCGASIAACTPPTRGAAVDLPSHLARFPADLAVLTTGGTQPHVLGGRSMILGPRDLAARTLAHEFGHILGFDDAYLRGYRSLGDDGYAIIELVPDRADIMSSSGGSEVQQRHFEQLVANLRAERAMKAGLAAMYERRNPREATTLFREVLADRPDHYGAHFQLAKALDQAGDSTSALVVWKRVLDLARASGDSSTAAIAARRVGSPDQRF